MDFIPTRALLSALWNSITNLCLKATGLSRSYKLSSAKTIL